MKNNEIKIIQNLVKKNATRVERYELANQNATRMERYELICSNATRMEKYELANSMRVDLIWNKNNSKYSEEECYASGKGMS